MTRRASREVICTVVRDELASSNVCGDGDKHQALSVGRCELVR